MGPISVELLLDRDKSLGAIESVDSGEEMQIGVAGLTFNFSIRGQVLRTMGLLSRATRSLVSREVWLHSVTIRGGQVRWEAEETVEDTERLISSAGGLAPLGTVAVVEPRLSLTRGPRTGPELEYAAQEAIGDSVFPSPMLQARRKSAWSWSNWQKSAIRLGLGFAHDVISGTSCGDEVRVRCVGSRPGRVTEITVTPIVHEMPTSLCLAKEPGSLSIAPDGAPPGIAEDVSETPEPGSPAAGAGEGRA